ncbi:MAG: 6-carboxytetrahydropterin synthase QueD [Marinilabiliales bacterium]|nr:MAG: 6-carboxytetrahydropterin synthase QueD [Marinilabiliales bacterium]
MKIRLSKEFSFEMAHALKDYDGKCRHIHGHSFKLVVTVIGEPIEDDKSPKNGMVIDYGDLKKIVNKLIVDQYDHALVLPEKSELIAKLEDTDLHTIILPFQPTSEKMLEHFAKMLQKELPKSLKLFSLKLHETATSFAEWFAEDN